MHHVAFRQRRGRWRLLHAARGVAGPSLPWPACLACPGPSWGRLGLTAPPHPPWAWMLPLPGPGPGRRYELLAALLASCPAAFYRLLDDLPGLIPIVYTVSHHQPLR